MSINEIIKILETILAGFTGLMGIVLLFRNVQTAWKWIALAGIIWAMAICFEYYVPGTMRVEFLGRGLVHLLRNLGMGFCLAFGMISVNTK